ncbi:MAG: phosphoribosylglycinamide formyltransferase [Clostridia bacterium]|nr:phosphoribosylglycinamide formyltransferase [Clostridia bacterium]
MLKRQPKARIAVLVSGGGTNLQALIDAERAGKIRNGKIELVLSSNPEAYALERAKNAAIPALTVSRKEHPDDFEAKIVEALEAYSIDLIVLAGFLSILSEDFTRRYDRRILNVHPSLIPAFCGKGYYGLRVHEAALARGVRLTGATVHFVNEIPDGGEIIMQKAVAVREGDDAKTLQRRVMEEAEWKILPASVEKVSAMMRRSGVTVR